MKTRKRYSAPVVLLAITLVLAACGKSGDSSTSINASDSPSKPSSSAVSEEPVKLTFWGSVPEEAGPQEAVDAWNAENPKIQVEYIRYVNDDSGNLKLDTALVTGQDVDLYVNYNKGFLGKRVDSKAALDLSQFSDYDILDAMGPEAADWQVNAKFYGIPTSKGNNFIFLNKNALDAANLPIPPLDWSQNDLRKYAKVLKQDFEYGYAQFDWYYYMQIDGTFQNAIAENKTSKFDAPEVRESLQNWHAMMHEDKSIPTYGDQSASKMAVDAMFLTKKAAMLGAGGWIFRSSNNLTDYPRDFKIAFATIPSAVDKQSNFKIEGGLGDVVSINANSEHKEEAWAFLKWYADVGSQYLAKGGRIPASKHTDLDQTVKLMTAGMEDLYDMDSLKAVVLGNSPKYINSIDRKVSDMRKEEIERYFLKEKSLDETIKSIVKRHNELLAQ
ncbi:extracellular solute-binding protein [Paenibacillus sp. FSL F4-0236]|uniref:ABC transporter substrate-binding protein n=1 Tax=Paenibacillus odorifer TaxID=189426 RepID=A0ABX3H6W8_9BACL|nr:extracellular solute-binding protein [Paenibacillus odorifer]OMD45964.1 hypothetical protein BSK51_27845 [Paenibacillus odorifer]